MLKVDHIFVFGLSIYLISQHFLKISRQVCSVTCLFVFQPMERGRVLRRPHFLSNANTALRFLASKRIKLVNINPADLVDGRPPVVLGLIWTIILYFQVIYTTAKHNIQTMYCANAMGWQFYTTRTSEKNKLFTGLKFWQKLLHKLD